MIKLRKFQISDKHKLIEILNDENVYQFLSSKIPTPYTEEDALWWINAGSKLGYIRAITLNEQLIGCIGVTPGEFEYSRSGEIGYWLCSHHWGKGITTTATKMITELVFVHSDLNRIFASVFSGNSASMKVLNKSGFTLDAILEQAIYKEGKFYNNHTFSLLKNKCSTDN